MGQDPRTGFSRNVESCVIFYHDLPAIIAPAFRYRPHGADDILPLIFHFSAAPVGSRNRTSRLGKDCQKPDAR